MIRLDRPAAMQPDAVTAPQLVTIEFLRIVAIVNTCTSKGTLTHTPSRMTARTEVGSDSTPQPSEAGEVEVG